MSNFTMTIPSEESGVAHRCIYRTKKTLQLLTSNIYKSKSHLNLFPRLKFVKVSILNISI